MGEQIYNVNRKVTVEGEDQEQPSSQGGDVSYELLRLIIGISAVVALIIATIAICLS
jgi:hypothetical protein